MTEYTKEQEAEALSRVSRNIFVTRDIDILYTMAKRTADAETAAQQNMALAKRLDTKRDVLEKQRDALLRQRKRDQKTIMELTNQLDKARVKERCETLESLNNYLRKEHWDALFEVLRIFISDATMAAQAVQTREAIRKMLEPKG